MRKTVKSVLHEILDNLPESNISLWGITDALNLRTGKRTMPHTVKEYCKEYADIAGGEFYCVKPREGKYHYKPFLKIAGAHRDK